MIAVAAEAGRRTATAALAAIAVAACGIVVVRSHFKVDGETQFTLVDDTMISLRYARNLARGAGFVWNVGEPPVEGFTNLGYTLLMTPGFAFGDTLFSRYLPVVITIGGLVATVLLTAGIARTIWPQFWTVPVAAGAMVALDFGLVFWSARGTEVSLVTAATLGMTLLFMRWRHSRTARELWCGAFCGAAAIVVRLDAAAIVLTVTTWLTVCEVLANRSPRDGRREVHTNSLLSRPVLVAFAVPIVTTATVLAFQVLYFSDALPNTYRLKMRGVSVAERLSVGTQELISNAAPQLRVLILLGPLLLALFSWSALRNGDIVVLILIAAVSVSYSVWVGGDYANAQVHAPNRFALVGIPALCILAAGGWTTAVTRLIPAARIGAVSAALGALAVAIVLWPNWHNNNLRSLFKEEIPLLKSDQQRSALGLYLGRVLPWDTTIAVHAAGQIPYYADLRAIDLLGKSDRMIANLPQKTERFRPGHNKWDYDHSIGELAPDVIVDTWGDLRSYLDTHPGYTRLPNGIWVSTKPHVPIDTVALGCIPTPLVPTQRRCG